VSGKQSTITIKGFLQNPPGHGNLTVNKSGGNASGLCDGVGIQHGASCETFLGSFGVALLCQWRSFRTTSGPSSRIHSKVLDRERCNREYSLIFSNRSRVINSCSSGQFPLVPSTVWNQLFGFQLFGSGSPFGFILGGLPANGLVVGKINGANLVGQALGFSIPGNQAVNSALVTTGARPVITSPYLIPQDPINFLYNDYGHSDFDTPQRAIVDFIYDLPFSRGSRFWGGWTISSIIVAQSGQPYTLFAGPAFGELTQRVNLNAAPQVTGNPTGYFGAQGLSLVGTDRTACPAVYANPSASSNPLFSRNPGLPGPCIGNSLRNQFYGPGYANTDMAVQKRFLVSGENRSLLLRAEFFNLFNRSNFYNPITALSTDGFTFNPQFGQVLSAHDNRQIQLAARFDF
jgi:hypothetical protein